MSGHPVGDPPYELWEAVCETERENQFGKPTTKHVSQRGGFTAIDAYHQIHVATGLWGPMGFPGGDPLKGGWGFYDEKWDTVRGADGTPLEIVFEGTFWYEGRRVGRFCADVAYRPGDDGRKKTLTDALTKALSYLGFSADVFLGAWDGSSPNKYANPTQLRQPRPARGQQAQAQAQGRGGNGYKPGPVRECPRCGDEGQPHRWAAGDFAKGGKRGPDFECQTCREDWNGRERNLRFYSTPKAGSPVPAPAPEPPPQDEPPVDAYENEAGDDPTASW